VNQSFEEAMSEDLSSEELLNCDSLENSTASDRLLNMEVANVGLLVSDVLGEAESASGRTESPVVEENETENECREDGAQPYTDDTDCQIVPLEEDSVSQLDGFPQGEPTFEDSELFTDAHNPCVSEDLSNIQLLESEVVEEGPDCDIAYGDAVLTDTVLDEYKIDDLPCVYFVSDDSGSVDETNGEAECDRAFTVDRRNTITRTRSLTGKVPETVPEETGPESEAPPSSQEPDGTAAEEHSGVKMDGELCENIRTIPVKPKRCLFYPRSYSVESRDLSISVCRETDGSSMEDSRMKRKDENLFQPCVVVSSSSLSKRIHVPLFGVSNPSSVVDIPPPFELASITKKPITKSSPSLLIENESPDKYLKQSSKKKSSFKRFLPIKLSLKKKIESKIGVEVNMCRTASEIGHHGSARVLDFDRRSLGNSPQLKSRSGKMRASDSASTFLFYKDGKKKGMPKTFSRTVSRVESFEDRSRHSYMSLPLTKPRSISFPNADTSDYENIPAMSSDYENIQIPPRRCARAGTFTEFFEDPSRAFSSACENDGYVDMSSFAPFDTRQFVDQESERNMSPTYCTFRPRSETLIVCFLQDFREMVARASGEDGTPVVDEENLTQILCEMPELCQFHQEMLKELEERVAQWYEDRKIADIILSKEPGLNLYRRFITKFERNMSILDECCQASSRFSAVVREFEVNRCGICPIAHRSVPRAGNFQKLLHIQHSVTGQHEIVQPGRVSDMNDVLLYTTPHNGRYKLNRTLSLAGMKVKRTWLSDHSPKLQILFPVPSSSCSSSKERDEWFDAISKALEDYRKVISERPETGLGVKPPTLIPDSRVVMCMICTCDFSLTWRRHHCNACGKVVCRTCSRNKYPLKYLKGRPSRVCDQCYKEFKTKGKMCTHIHRSHLFARSPGSALSSVFHSIQPSSIRKQKRISAALMEDKVASESLPLLGFTIQRPDKGEGQTETGSVFQLYHKKTLFYSFKAEDTNSAQRWIEAMLEASIL
uniref:FYVE, RhoGEF and PH domain containing 5 n=1 Tax=Callorhinchus milii TaxID=7868 RepID=A0A4W3KB95_CALMI